MIALQLLPSKQMLTVSSLYDGWYVRKNQCCLIRLCEQQTVNHRPVRFDVGLRRSKDKGRGKVVK